LPQFVTTRHDSPGILRILPRTTTLCDSKFEKRPNYEQSAKTSSVLLRFSEFALLVNTRH